MSAFVMSLAGLLVRVEPLHARVAAMCAPYRVDGPMDGPADGPMDVPTCGGAESAAVGPADDHTLTTEAPAAAGRTANPDLVVRVTPDMIRREREMGEPGDWSDDYLETLAVFRAIGERLPLLDRAILHGACVEWDGRAYLFTAPSGTGKSTHIRLWRRCLGERVRVINGDKPIVHVSSEAGGPDPVTIHATPWAGKEGWQTPLASAPLAGVCVVSRGTDNTCRRLDAAEALPVLLAQSYMPSDPLQAAAWLALADRLLAVVPFHLLSCDISEDAVRASFTAMTGRSWAERAIPSSDVEASSASGVR